MMSSIAAEKFFPIGEFSDQATIRAFREAFDLGAHQALLDYADLLEGPQYTMNYTDAFAYREQVIQLLRRDADLFYGADAPARSDAGGETE